MFEGLLVVLNANMSTVRSSTGSSTTDEGQASPNTFDIRLLTDAIKSDDTRRPLVDRSGNGGMKAPSIAIEDTPKQRIPEKRSGVHLKHFETVVAKVLRNLEPKYTELPPAPTATNDGDWPFSSLPKASRVYGKNPGQLKNESRAKRKEDQLRSMLRCILHLVPENPETDFTIVDFGGGSGHLGIPLALLLPHCRIVVVDFNKRSLDLMRSKANMLAKEMAGETNKELPKTEQFAPTKDSSALSSWGVNGVLDNLFAFEGPVENFTRKFHIAVALHLCGQATDVALRSAAACQAPAIVVAPCCVGKLSQKVLNPDIFHATGQNTATVKYPQSEDFCQLITDPDDWDALAKAADYSNQEEARTPLNATRRAAKALLETDRRLFLEQQYGYSTALMRMDPWEATPKNDILVAWKSDELSRKAKEVFLNTDPACQADIEMAKSYLLELNGAGMMENSCHWTTKEEEEIESTIEDFLRRTQCLPNSLDLIHTFPTGMGGRKRKVIHFVAERKNLAHWSVGYKDREKTVAISRKKPK